MDSKDKAHYGLWLAYAYKAASRLDEARALVEVLRREEKQFPAALALLEIDLLLAASQPEQALQLLDAKDSDHPEQLLRRGEALLRLSRFEDAEDAYRRALAADPDDPRAWHGLAKATIGRKDYTAAAEAALAAVSRRYAYPEAHFHFGVASIRLNRFQEAETAFRVALAQRPGFIPAHRWLAKLYRHLQRADLAEAHERFLREAGEAA